MEPEVLAALITAAAGVGGGVLERVKRVAAERKLDVRAAQSVHDQLIQKYGFKIREQMLKVKIEDETGRTKVRREFLDLEVVTEGFRLRTLAHYSENTGSSSSPIDLEVMNEANVQIGSRPRQWFGGHGVAEIGFNPDGLQKGRPVSYALTYECEGGLLTKKADISQRYSDELFKMEYYTARAQFPVDKMVIELEFPDGRPCACSPVVFLPRSEVSMQRLGEEIEKRFSRNHRGARLEIAQPLIEFGYGICWQGS